MRIFAAVCATFVLTACASVGDEGGWTGQGAQPFDGAKAACTAEAHADTGTQFEACMAGKGWTRTH